MLCLVEGLDLDGHLVLEIGVILIEVFMRSQTDPMHSVFLRLPMVAPVLVIPRGPIAPPFVL